MMRGSSSKGWTREDDRTWGGCCLAECGGDRNENERRGGKTSKRKRRRRWGVKGEERRERKEGVRVRGWRSNKELLRYDRQTATTWPHYGRFPPAERLSSLPRRLSFPPLFSFPYLGPILDFRSRVMPCLAHETFQTRQYVMFEDPRPCLRSFYVE